MNLQQKFKYEFAGEKLVIVGQNLLADEENVTVVTTTKQKRRK